MHAVPHGQVFKGSDTTGDTRGQFYVLSHPMLFEDSPAPPTGNNEYGRPTAKATYSETCDVYVVGVRGAIPRVVIHAAHRLQGEDGYSYGGLGCRVVEGIHNADMGLMLQGYRVSERTAGFVDAKE